ncbi:MAG: hypothetical protein LBQ96_07905 [Fusobacteriaceae bacterium]|jgi:predicted DsbA family dithiol-disulfide isomerase|nr:hypothetical protein [Fusobacteriaceae bacterium]
MSKIQVFYDYSCPFCKKGYAIFKELLKNRTDLLVEWIPTEAHPRPEAVHPHTDLCGEAYYVAEEMGADILAFHDAMFEGVVTQGRDVEKIEEIVDIVKGIVDSERFKTILADGKYAEKPGENNDLAYEKSGVWVLPAFRMDGKKLDALGGIGVTEAQLREFLG